MPQPSRPALRQRLATSLLAALVLPPSLSAVAVTAVPSSWSCDVLVNKSLRMDAGHGSGRVAATDAAAPAVWWTKHNCSGEIHTLPKQRVGPIVVNIAHARLSADATSPVLRPAVARTPLGLARLHEMAASAAVDYPGFVPLAGVNGGYFYEVNRASFFDDVCIGKTRADALRNASDADPDAGIGDCLTVADGRYLSANCDKIGNSEPVAAVLDYPPHFVQQKRAERLPAGVKWAIGAGPNLVARDPATNQSVISVVGDNVNIVETASNTALALRGSEFMLVTFDGHDGCRNATCGVNSHQLAHFLLDYVGVDTAMEMDQGGSTAMWVRGEPGSVAGEPGVVTNPGTSERQLFNAVFIGVINGTLAPVGDSDYM